MKVLLCVNKDLLGIYALNKMLPRLMPEHEVVVCLSDRLMQHKDLHVEPLDLLRLFERDLLIETIFPLLDAHPPVSPEWRTFKGLAEHYDIPVELVTRINSPAGVAWFKNAAPDVIVSVRYGYVFGEGIIDIPTHGIYNVHSGILPQYRGTMPTFRAMVNESAEIGITLHKVPDAGIDVGEVVETHCQPVDRQRSMLWNLMALYAPAVDMIDRLVKTIAAGDVPAGTVQDESQAGYYSFPTEKEISAFLAKGYTFVQREEYMEWLQQFTSERTAAVERLFA